MRVYNFHMHIKFIFTKLLSIYLWRYDDNYELSKRSAVTAKGVTKAGEEMGNWERP